MAQKPRAIFEEVGDARKRDVAQTGVIDRGRGGARGAIRLWLAVLFALVVAMIVVGGATRLTESGLSITEWAPISGAVPPLSEAQMQAEFERYQLSPQFAALNSDMDLAGFKRIYWWEWGHRQLGRGIGVIWALGMLGFAVTRKIPVGWTGRLLSLGVLGALQGAIGWWMVHSGLQAGMVAVASYRLAIHLGLAFGILGLIAWYILCLSRREGDLIQARRLAEPRLFSMATGVMHFALLQVLLGALVAGIDAGRAFPSWPLMAGGVFPPDPFQLSPIWRNFFEDAGLVQFIHRCSGYLLAVFAVVVMLRARRSPHARTRGAFALMLAVMGLQIVLGIVTVLQSAPLSLALAHQICAIALWVAIIRARFYARYPLPQSVRGT